MTKNPVKAGFVEDYNTYKWLFILARNNEQLVDQFDIIFDKQGRLSCHKVAQASRLRINYMVGQL